MFWGWKTSLLHIALFMRIPTCILFINGFRIDSSREFTRRVKSVSMAKFITSEVSALQAGGNERAREIYFKEFDPQRHSILDSSNVVRLWDFIKHVYMDRRYTSERPVDKPPRIRMTDKEDTYESRKVDPYRGGSRSPPFENQCYNERPGVGELNVTWAGP